VSERRACAALGQYCSTQRKVPRGREDAERLTADIIELARQCGRYGYRKIAALLRQAGWSVSDGRRLNIGRSIKPSPHHLRDTAAIVTIRLIDLHLQHGPHVPRLDTDHRQACFDQSAVKPLRQWSGFQPHPLEVAGAVLQQWQ
jgi:hypothetical protein